TPPDKCSTYHYTGDEDTTRSTTTGKNHIPATKIEELLHTTSCCQRWRLEELLHSTSHRRQWRHRERCQR
ncbi:Hypothetical predicted protein, partial [Olea europaea subsp. europaea]